ncbi:vancomycin resistance response regulator transcription factor VanR-C [Enterococcus sp.]|mgnify:FL=1|jgi:two-component system response regulator VanR|uniref:vancomycin resistance response regulator transcription factor VanR-C n=1 Tax=Enterococcus sp. TaxID=35783 RepID=UPI0025C6D8FB|nr:vancomycin resistance response regulator transcription factor VanR-C [Enterococcus sp.]
MSEKIVVVDDEKEIADLVTTFLQNEGFHVQAFYDGTSAIAYIEKEAIDLAVLDVMLPDIDGFQLLQQIRKTHFFPVLMLTAKGEDLDKITGLSLGADDYVTKPFNPLEVVARVKTQLRRYQRYNHSAASQPVEEYEKDGLLLKINSHQCLLYGKEVLLTPIEFKILLYLFEHQGSVVSSETLFESVWKEKYLDNNNTVMAHIARLREKLNEEPRKPKLIKTVWGVGYIIEK